MGDENVTRRECTLMNEALSQKIDKVEEKVDSNFKTVFEKLDLLIHIKVTADSALDKANTAQTDIKHHSEGHWKWIAVTLGTLALIGYAIIAVKNLLG